MNVRSYDDSCGQASNRRLWPDERASQILELALSLPLLMVFVVGIFDFSGALAVKQKLTNAAREAARVAAADPANDLGNALPASVIDAFQVADNYLISEKMNDCGLPTPSASGSPLTWTSTALGCGSVPPNGMVLTINRGFVTQQKNDTATTDVVSTQVTIKYAYNWRFNSVIRVLVPGSTKGNMSYITTSATAFNEN